MVDVTSLVWETNGKGVAQKVQCCGVNAKLGRETKMRPPAALVKAMCATDALNVIGLYGLGDKVYLFLQDWELAKVALSCHMALDMPGQKFNGPW